MSLHHFGWCTRSVNRLDLELLLQAGDDAFAERHAVAGWLTPLLVGERRGVGAVGDVDRLALLDALERLVRRLGLRHHREQSRPEQQQSSHRGPRKWG